MLRLTQLYHGSQKEGTAEQMARRAVCKPQFISRHRDLIEILQAEPTERAPEAMQTARSTNVAAPSIHAAVADHSTPLVHSEPVPTYVEAMRDSVALPDNISFAGATHTPSESQEDKRIGFAE